MVLSLFRTTIQRSEAGIVKILSGAVCTLYNTMPDGSAPITVAGVVSLNAPKTAIYSDRAGAVVKSNPIIADAQGTIEAFTSNPEFHILVVLTDGTRYGILWVTHTISLNYVNAKAYPTIQAAIDALDPVSGGTVEIPEGNYNSTTVPAVTAMLLNSVAQGNKKIHLRGAGIDKTILTFTQINTDLLTIVGFADVHIEGITFTGGFSVGGSGRGLVLDACRWPVIENCKFDRFPHYALEVVDNGTDNVGATFRNCEFSNSFSGAAGVGVVMLARTFRYLFDLCQFYSFVGSSPRILNLFKCSLPVFQNCTFESSLPTNSKYVFSDESRQVTFKGCWFESYSAINPPTDWFIEFGSGGGTTGHILDTCRFVRGGSSVLRLLKSAGNGHFTFLNNDGIVNAVPTGTDDISLASSDHAIFLGDNIVTDINYTVRKQPVVLTTNVINIVRSNIENNIVNVMDYSSFQAAHDALPAIGGTIFIPYPVNASGVYNHTGSGGPTFAGSGSTPALTITKPITLLGDERIPALRDFGTGAENRDAIRIDRDGNVSIKNLAILGKGVAGTGNLIHWYKVASNMQFLEIKNVYLLDASAWAFKSVPDTNFFTALLVMEDVHFGSSQFGGAMGGAGGSGSGDVLIGNGLNSGSNNCWFNRCRFAGPAYGTYGPNALPKGCVHFNQIAVTYFSGCSCQPKDTSPFLSMENYISNLTMRDLYQETSTDGTPGNAAYRIIYDSASGELWNFVVDTGHFHQQDTTSGGKFFKSGNGSQIKNVSFNNISISSKEATLIATDEIVIGTGVQEITLNNCQITSDQDGSTREMRVTGATFRTIASAANISIPSGNQDIFSVTGTNAITSITPSRAGRKIVLVFAGILTFTNGATLKLNAATNFVTSANDTIELICDGTNWLELCRSVN